MAAKARAGSGAAKRGTAAAKSPAKTPAQPAAKPPAKTTTAKVAAPVRAKSGADAARPVNGPGARKGATQVRNKPAPVSARSGPARPVRDDLDDAAPSEFEVSGPPTWLRWTTFVLALAGLGVSIYLTYAHYTESALAGCTETTGVVNCGKVTTSAQSVVFGIPVAVLGLAFYAFLAVIMSPWAWLARRREIGLLRLASMIVGIGFVLYLLYAELFDIGSICLYCTSVHVITFVLFVLTGLAVAVWGLSPQVQQRQPLR
ncbi:MAG TPA: vitamin K epoxide reductase family protein [Streptosporangiaceae bacterium]|jgi:uncharacterized membrane protein|nr:vitamin K epoxide reductase family protein [Streptosporangiaceae bacterium]